MRAAAREEILPGGVEQGFHPHGPRAFDVVRTIIQE
jgi:hypothetical protein